jgi:hypothetical protein
VVMWKVMFLSNWIMPLSGVWRSSDMSVRHTGKRMMPTSTCSTRAEARAMVKVKPKMSRAPFRLSLRP